MICTVTFNPSLDYIVSVKDFTPGKVNRTAEELMFPGGKGINVSIVLKNLGMDSTALGFVAGFTGEEIRRRLKDMGIRERFIVIDQGMSRINVKLRSDKETEINGMGPVIDCASMDALYAELETLKADDVLVLAGSIPASMPETVYCDILKHLDGRGILTAVDASRDLLRNVLPFRPFLIKPNHHELGELFGVTLKTREDVIPYAEKLKDRGARNVLVSMAGEGAVLLAEDGSVHSLPAPKGTVKNSVGAGDSMVAGFLYGYLTSGNYEAAFRTGIACGSASAFSDRLAEKEEVKTLLRTL